MSLPLLKFAKLSKNATTPTKGSILSAGYDLYSAENIVIEPQNMGLVMTDIQIAVPYGCYGRIAPRSGLTLKHFIDVGAGVIDADYRGNLGVVLFNFSGKAFCVERGDRIAQLILERIEVVQLIEVPLLEETFRGKKGFGSTGKN